MSRELDDLHNWLEERLLTLRSDGARLGLWKKDECLAKDILILGYDGRLVDDGDRT